MAPEDAAPSPEDTPASDSQQGTPEEGNWEQRYKDLQAHDTQVSQEAAEYRELIEAAQSQDPERRNWALANLGYEMEGGDTQEELDPQTQMAQRLESVEEYLASGQEQAAIEQMQAQDIEIINEALDGFEARLGGELTEAQIKVIANYADVNRNEDGSPNVDEALSVFEEAIGAVAKEQKDQWVRSKAVSTPSVGQEPVETPSLEGHPERVANMVEQIKLRDGLT